MNKGGTGGHGEGLVGWSWGDVCSIADFQIENLAIKHKISDDIL